MTRLLADLIETAWRHPLRSVSTVLGIAWGTLAVVLLLAFGFAMETAMQRKAAGLGRGIAIVWPQRTTLSHAGVPEGRLIRLTPGDVARVADHVPEIEAISPELVDVATLRRGARVFRVEISGVHPEFAQLRTMDVRPGGRFVDAPDVELGRRVVFLGDRIAEGLFDDRDPVGRTLQLRGARFTVIGVLQPKEQDSNYGALDGDRICIPASTHARLFGRRFVSNFVLRPRSPAVHARAMQRMREVIARAQQFDPADREALYVWDLTDQERMLRDVYFGFDLLIGLSGALTLLVGGVGVGNLMFVLVRQRTREIGLLMALGATPRRILAGVLGHALLLVGAGGAIGFGIAWSCAAIARNIEGVQDTVGRPEISAPLAGGTIALLAVVALLAGWFPARRAARLDPVEALNA